MGGPEWSRVEPTTFETTVAILICATEDRNAQQVRPGQGDRGVDVYVPVAGGDQIDVYQAKHYTSLNASQRRKIVSSLKRAVDEVGDKMRSWHLVIPMNPTPKLSDWFDSTVRPLTSVECFWNGLTYLDLMAAEKPAVIDYHLYGDRRRVDERLEQVSSLLDLTAEAAAGRLSVESVATTMAGLVRQVNDDDPHFQYQVSVGPHEPMPPPDATWGNIGHRAWFDGTMWVGITVTSRFAQALAARGAPAFSLRVSSADPAVMAEFDDFVEFGTTATIPASAVTELIVSGPPSIQPNLPLESGIVTLSSPSISEDHPLRVLNLSLQDDDGDLTLPVLVERVGMGQRPDSGRSMEGKALGGGLQFSVRLGRPAGRTGALVFSLRDIAESPVGTVINSLRFAHRVVWAREFTISQLAGEVEDRFTFDQDGERRELVSGEALAYFEDLAFLSKRASRPLLVPEAYSKSDRVEADRAVRLLSGERLSDSRSRLAITVTTADRVGLRQLLATPGSLIQEGPAWIDIQDQRIPLGTARRIFPNATLAEEPEWDADDLVLQLALGAPGITTTEILHLESSTDT